MYRDSSLWLHLWVNWTFKTAPFHFNHWHFARFVISNTSCLRGLKRSRWYLVRWAFWFYPRWKASIWGSCWPDLWGETYRNNLFEGMVHSARQIGTIFVIGCNAEWDHSSSSCSLKMAHLSVGSVINCCSSNHRMVAFYLTNKSNTY